MLLPLQSISEISRVIETGSQPVVVMASDLEEYACKHDSKNNLINEFVAHQLLKIWGLHVFPFAFIQIKKEHIPIHFLGGHILYDNFNSLVFGLKYNNEALDVTNILLGLKNDNYELSKFTSRLDLLKIGLFDLWVANEDRNHNNYNILISENRFIPIDHSAIFNTGRLGQQLEPLTEDDSILNSELSIVFLNQKKKVGEEANKLIYNFPTFVNACNDILPKIVDDIPDDWCNNKTDLLSDIRSAIIENDDWLKENISAFSQLIHKLIR